MLSALLLTLLQAAPGWQQDVRYRIRASLDEERFTLAGTQELLYRNRSPDTLRTISFHLHLNAFRPGSRWADRDSVEGRFRFNRLPDPEFAFNHVSDVAVDGRPVVAEWPFAPDSTVVRFRLPRALPPGDALTVTMRWDARPSTLPRRQGRRGRHYDFAQWYPRVVVYDRHGWNEHPLYPAGEFYGEFGSFLVRLDVAEDQVIGATGVPLCGDPGWARARRPAGARVTLQRDWYASPRDPAARGGDGACAPEGPGRKTVLWYAEDVHHFAMSMNPEFRYEEGDVFERPVRVLYQPGAERTWGAGLAVGRTETALVWLDELFGLWPWPQITNVHRLEGGGTEFPMLMMNGSPDQGLILHELGHNYLMGILANNEWREGWLDEGFTSFQTTWFHQTLGRRGAYRALEERVLGWDLDRLSEPVSQPGEAFRDFAAYGAMTYARGELFFHQLRSILGDETMRRVLREYYAAYRFRHVDEDALRAVAERVSGRDLSTFFRQWLHETVRWDYRVGKVTRAWGGEGWVTTVEVVARDAGRYPVIVQVAGEADTARVRAPGVADRETVTVATQSRPRRVTIDPDALSHDWNFLNNGRGFGLLGGGRTLERYLDPWFSRRSRRDRLTLGLSPTAWYNDAGGWTFGWRARTDYLGRFAQDEFWGSVSTGWGSAPNRLGGHYSMTIRNPTWIGVPGLSTWVSAATLEGRNGADLGVAWSRPSFAGVPRTTLGARLGFVSTQDREDLAYLDPSAWDDATIIELEGRVATRLGGVALEATFAGGRASPRHEADLRTQPYLRATLTAATERPLGRRASLGLRGYAGIAAADSTVVRQRLVPLSARDPWDAWTSPLLRSRGALLRRENLHYHDPGGAGIRALGPSTLARRAVGLTVELGHHLRQSGDALFHRVTLAGFADAAFADGDLDPGRGTRLRGVADAGIGLRADHRVGTTRFQTRLDLPMWVSRPDLAQDDGPGARRSGFRWLVSFQPAVAGR